MRVSINNKEVETEASTLSQLTNEFSLPVQGIAIAVNNRTVPCMGWTNYALSEGISIVIIKAACDGQIMKAVQFITYYAEKYSYLDSARMALKGGCRWTQLRMKDAGKEEIMSVVMEPQNLYNDCGAIFIIDDHVELVKEIGAGGVYLGKNDMSVVEAWCMFGDEYIIGSTANTYEDVKKHRLDGVNYTGCGPFRYTTIKQKLSPISGSEGCKEVIRKVQEEKICHPPVVAIGGITSADIPAIVQTGITGIAFSGTVLRTDSPVEEMRKILAVTDQTDNY